MERRYFIAIVPPNELCEQITAIKQDFASRFNSKGALRSPAHITLHMPFLWKEEKEDKLINTLQQFCFSGNSFFIQLQNYSRFGERVIFIDVARNEILKKLQVEIVRFVKEKLQLFNQDEDLRGFHPHVTVAFRDLKKQHFQQAWAEYQGREFNAEFVCNNFTLLKHDGKNWNVHRTFALGDK